MSPITAARTSSTIRCRRIDATIEPLEVRTLFTGDGLADRVVAYRNSGKGAYRGIHGADHRALPDHPDTGQLHGVSPSVVLADDGVALTLPEDSYVTVLFEDETVVDLAGDDFFVEEAFPVGRSAGEAARVWGWGVGQETWTELGTAGGGGKSWFDLADADLDQISMLWIQSENNLGGWPGFDLAWLGAAAGHVGPAAEVQVAGSVELMIDDGGDRFPLIVKRVDASLPIDPSARTWVLTHGHDSSPDGAFGDADDGRLLSAILAARPGDQVLTVDWSGAVDNVLPTTSERRIADAGGILASALKWGVGVPTSSLTLIGHSYGSYVSYEAARTLGGVDAFVALDPAADVSGGYSANGNVDFAAVSRRSWAFHAVNSGRSSTYGSEVTAATADEAFVVIAADGDYDVTHSAPLDVLAGLIRHGGAGEIGEHFSLDRLIAAGSAMPPWRTNAFSRQGFSIDADDPLDFEAVLATDVTSSAPEALTFVRAGGSAAVREFRVGGTNGDDHIDFVNSDGGSVGYSINGKSRLGTDAFGSTALIASGGDGNDVIRNLTALSATLYGGNGEDRLAATSGAMYASGGSGDDTLIGGSGDDTLTAGAGRNRVYGGDGKDRLNGAAGRDFLYGEGGDDRIYGGGGNDYLDGGGNVDRIFGGDGDDSILGGSAIDRLYGEAGNDTLVGGKGKDYLFGDAGNDVGTGDAEDILSSIETP